MAMLKRVLSAALALALLLCCVPMAAIAAETEEATIVTTEPSVETTEEATEVPTEEPTEAPTEEATEAPTEDPTEEAAEAPTEGATVPAEEPTQAPEEPAPTDAEAPEPDDAPSIAEPCTETLQEQHVETSTSTASEEAMASIVPASSQFSEWEWEVLRLVNIVRYSEGVSPLTGFSLMQQAADVRADEILTYFSHERPDGTSFYTVLDDFGIGCSYCGENIAYGYWTPMAVMGGWMNSSGHRANILNSGYNCLGVGYNSGAAVQIFAANGRYTSISFVLPDATFPGGTTLDEMEIYAVLYNTVYGNCYLPLMSEYCTGYDPYQGGQQTVTVSVLGVTGTFDITLDIPVPAKPHKIANVATGIQVQWSEVDGASQYGVWRSDSENGTYTLIDTTTSTLYTDTSVTAGQTCYYRVSAIFVNGTHSEKSPAVSATCVPAPKVVAATSGAYVHWDAIPGATEYGVWCSKNGINGTYTLLGTTAATNYTNRNVPSGSTYYYAISIVDASGSHSTRSKAVNHTFLSTPASSVRNMGTGVRVSWNKVAGAQGYAVYRKNYTSTAWTRVATITNGSRLTWTDTSVRSKNGQAYYYTVRALAGSNLTILSAQRINGNPILRLTTQSLKYAVKVSPTAIKCAWSTSKVVAGYEICLMVGDQVYRTYTVSDKTTDTKALTGLPGGKTYTVQLRTYQTLDDVTYYSGWSNSKNVTLS